MVAGSSYEQGGLLVDHDDVAVSAQQGDHHRKHRGKALSRRGTAERPTRHQAATHGRVIGCSRPARPDDPGSPQPASPLSA